MDATCYRKSNLLSVKFADCFWALLMLLFSIPSSAAIKTSDARSKSLALAGAALTSDATGWSNPAALAFLDRPCMNLQAENPWCVPELSAGGLSFCLPVRAGTFALSFSRFGYEAYHESQAGFSFGKSLGKKVKAGISLDYRKIKQYADYGDLFAIIPSCGIQILPLPCLVLGLQVSNPGSQRYYPHRFMKYPALVKIGLAYQPDPDILFCFDVNSESGCKPVYCGGIEYNFEKQFIFRLGLSSSRCMQYSLGIGYSGKRLKTDIAVSHHPVLGFSPAITLTFLF
jgi:hypothetical protein